MQRNTGGSGYSGEGRAVRACVCLCGGWTWCRGGSSPHRDRMWEGKAGLGSAVLPVCAARHHT
ncbi:hypothetical protein E2C01_090587 [Portunus trituberculatus]|uniref:Uncharacterized protein n=1 Tax=Portunus trituberculatus TaxID=210409 RepID=A0A5B7JKJ9_PORTR|nr:hypothetical protein [Portunus trituberculatus]